MMNSISPQHKEQRLNSSTFSSPTGGDFGGRSITVHSSTSQLPTSALFPIGEGRKLTGRAEPLAPQPQSESNQKSVELDDRKENQDPSSIRPRTLQPVVDCRILSPRKGPLEREMGFFLSSSSSSNQTVPLVPSRELMAPVKFKSHFLDLIQAIMRRKSKDPVMQQRLENWEFDCPHLNQNQNKTTNQEVIKYYQDLMQKLPEEYYFEVGGDFESLLQVDMYLKIIKEAQKAALLIAKQLQESPSFKEWKEIIRQQVHGFITLSQVLKSHDRLRQGITSLSLSGYFLFYPLIVNPELFPALRSIQITGSKIFHVCDYFSSFQSLESVDLSRNCFWEIPSMNVSDHLFSVNLEKNGIRFIDLSLLPRSLRILNIGNNPMESVLDHKMFSRFPHLEEVSLSGINLNSFPDFSGFKCLRSINVSKNKIESVKSSFFPKSLNHLDISENLNIRIEFQKDWTGGGALKSLNLRNICCQLFSDLSSIPILENLNLSGNKLIEFNSKKFKKLKVLNLSQNQPLSFLPSRERSLFQSLKCFDDLVELNLSEIGLNSVPNLSTNANLKIVDLHGNNITYVSFFDLPSSLEYLDVSNNPKLNGIQLSYFYPDSEQIEVDNNNRSFETNVKVERIKKYKNLDNLKFLNLSGDRSLILYSNNKDSVFFMFGYFLSLEKLDLSFIGLSFIPNLDALSRLKELHLRGNRLTLSTQELRSLKGLTYLDLSENLITKADSSFFPEGLRILKLSLNRLNCDNLTQVLRELGDLKELDLSATSLTKVPDCSSCRALEKLDLSKNLIQEIEFRRLPPNLQDLNMDGNFLGPQDPSASKSWNGQVEVPLRFQYLVIHHLGTGISSLKIEGGSGVFAQEEEKSRF